MWSTRHERLDGGRVLRFVIERDGKEATFADVLGAFEKDAEFRSLFNDTLADAPFAAFRWETRRKAAQ